MARAAVEMSTSDPFTDAFNQHIIDSLARWNVPGTSIAIVDGDQVHHRGYGFSSLPDTAVTAQTLFFAASTTKAMLAAVLSHLIRSKKYPELAQGWETPISSMIRDDFVVPDAWATANLTLDDALCHRTGLSGHDEAGHTVRDGKPVTVRDMVRSMRHFPSGWQPRTKYQYNNNMYITLSHVVEVVTRKSLGENMREIIWEPLGMNSTYFGIENLPSEHRGELAKGYAYDRKTKAHREVPALVTAQCSGGGAVISNAVDYAKWIKCLLTKSLPLSEEVHNDIRKPRTIAVYSPSQGQDIKLYGAGWYRTTLDGHVLYRHSGGTDCMITQVFWLPEHNYGVAMFCNDAEGGNGLTLDVVMRLLCEKVGMAVEKRPDMSKIIGDWLESTYTDWDNAAKEVYPDQPATPLESPLPIEQLVGEYYDDAYGKLDLVQKTVENAKGESETILFADRPDAIWRASFSFHHVTGAHWLLRIVNANGNPALSQYQGAEFQIGSDGKPAGIRIDWNNYGGNSSNGVTVFKRV